MNYLSLNLLFRGVNDGQVKNLNYYKYPHEIKAKFEQGPRMVGSEVFVLGGIKISYHCPFKSD